MTNEKESETFGRVGQVSVEREGKRVIITIECDTEYEAIAGYDAACVNLKSGHVKIEIIGRET